MTARVFLAHQINILAENYQVFIITNLKTDRFLLDNISKKVNFVDLPIKREINLFYDIKSLFLLIRIFNINKFSLVHSVSPKAGLLTSIASLITKIENRLHTFTGQVWVSDKGIRRWFFKLMDKIIVQFNTNILVDSFSQQEFLINEKILNNKSSIVLGKGSISGVDTNRFKPSKIFKKSIRKEFNINQNSLIFLYVGRLKKEKGIFELIKAFRAVNKIYNHTSLLIVGPDEEELKPNLIKLLESSLKFVRFINFTKVPEQFMAASDIFILPSYREGFGSVVIEAASCGIPAIGSNIYGLKDSIRDGKTGMLIKAQSTRHLKVAMLKCVENKDFFIKMGLNARTQATNHFSQDYITKKILKLYKRLIQE